MSETTRNDEIMSYLIKLNALVLDTLPPPPNRITSKTSLWTSGEKLFFALSVYVLLILLAMNVGRLHRQVLDLTARVSALEQLEKAR